MYRVFHVDHNKCKYTRSYIFELACCYYKFHNLLAKCGN